jgi:hypothetical protein
MKTNFGYFLVSLVWKEDDLLVCKESLFFVKRINVFFVHQEIGIEIL